jgi:hypothetical protein
MSWQQRIPEIAEAGPSPGSKGSPDNSNLPTATELFPAMGIQGEDWATPGPERTLTESPSRDQRPDLLARLETDQSQLSGIAALHTLNIPTQESSDLLSVETPVTSFLSANSAGNDAIDGDVSRSARPSFSRQSSLGRFSSRPMPETQVHVEDDQVRTISFAEQPDRPTPRSAAHSRHHSRRGSQRSVFGTGDASVSIPELAESYKFDGAPSEPGEAGGSAYSTQGIALSFNDLPSRAQHLIINELLRQNSRDTAVVLTTLPIPSEGTSLDEIASIQYLSDVEVLCNQLPPTLMVLSNNMTVTVSL